MKKGTKKKPSYSPEDYKYLGKLYALRYPYEAAGEIYFRNNLKQITDNKNIKDMKRLFEIFLEENNIGIDEYPKKLSRAKNAETRRIFAAIAVEIFKPEYWILDITDDRGFGRELSIVLGIKDQSTSEILKDIKTWVAEDLYHFQIKYFLCMTRVVPRFLEETKNSKTINLNQNP